jgi:hypothetical protein
MLITGLICNVIVNEPIGLGLIDILGILELTGQMSIPGQKSFLESDNQTEICGHNFQKTAARGM